MCCLPVEEDNDNDTDNDTDNNNDVALTPAGVALTPGVCGLFSCPVMFSAPAGRSYNAIVGIVQSNFSQASHHVPGTTCVL